jgi:hypothetical protein
MVCCPSISAPGAAVQAGASLLLAVTINPFLAETVAKLVVAFLS